MIFNILDNEWELQLKEEDDKFEELDGYTDFYNRKIVVCNAKEENRDLSNYVKKVIRHEIIHAFLYESGLAHSSLQTGAWAINEEMIDWIAIQFHKIEKVIHKVYGEMENEQEVR